METKIKFKVEERTYRNNMGQLHIGYITRLLVGKKIDETAFAAALGKATNMSVPKVNYVMMETAEYVMRRLFEGSSVSVPKLGTFKLSLKSHAVIQKRQAGVSAMDSITIKFQPCVEIKRKLQIPNLQFKEVDSSPKSKKL